jgi:hypothetical protein
MSRLDLLSRTNGNTKVEVISSGGSVAVAHVVDHISQIRYDEWVYESFSTDHAADKVALEGDRWLGFGGFKRTYLRTNQSVVSEWSVLLPHWFLMIVAVLPGVLALRRRGIRERRRTDRLCTHCGYDLRASPGRCPECGETAEMTKG